MQNGIRSLVIMDNLVEVEKKVMWKDLRLILYANCFPQRCRALLSNKDAKWIKKLISM